MVQVLLANYAVITAVHVLAFVALPGLVQMRWCIFFLYCWAAVFASLFALNDRLRVSLMSQ